MRSMLKVAFNFRDFHWDVLQKCCFLYSFCNVIYFFVSLLKRLSPYDGCKRFSCSTSPPLALIYQSKDASKKKPTNDTHLWKRIIRVILVTDFPFYPKTQNFHSICEPDINDASIINRRSLFCIMKLCNHHWSSMFPSKSSMALQCYIAVSSKNHRNTIKQRWRSWNSTLKTLIIFGVCIEIINSEMLFL